MSGSRSGRVVGAARRAPGALSVCPASTTSVPFGRTVPTSPVAIHSDPTKSAVRPRSDCSLALTTVYPRRHTSPHGSLPALP